MQTAFFWEILQLLDMMTSMIARRLAITQSCMLALLPWRELGLLRQDPPMGRVSFRNVVPTDPSRRRWEALCDGVAVRGAVCKLHINHPDLLAAFFFSFKAFTSSSDRPACSDQDRQYNSGFLYKQAGKDPLTPPVPGQTPTASSPPVFISPVVEMILPVMERVYQQGLSLVAPWWPAKSWYAKIISWLAARLWQLYLPIP